MKPDSITHLHTHIPLKGSIYFNTPYLNIRHLLFTMHSIACMIGPSSVMPIFFVNISRV